MDIKILMIWKNNNQTCKWFRGNCFEKKNDRHI